MATSWEERTYRHHKTRWRLIRKEFLHNGWECNPKPFRRSLRNGTSRKNREPGTLRNEQRSMFMYTPRENAKKELVHPRFRDTHLRAIHATGKVLPVKVSELRALEMNQDVCLCISRESKRRESRYPWIPRHGPLREPCHRKVLQVRVRAWERSEVNLHTSHRGLCDRGLNRRLT